MTIATEAAQAKLDEMISELADLYEVAEALMRSYNMAPDKVQVEQECRRLEGGGFEQRIRLVWIE